MRTFPSTLTAALIAMLVAATLGAQTRDDRADGDRAEQREAAQRRRGIAESVLLWVEDYERDRLVPRGVLNAEPSLQPRYARVARAHDLLSLRDGGALMHVDALQKLLYFAERDPDETIAAAVLSVAAAGFDRSLAERDPVVLRDLGHTSLSRMEHQGVWFYLMRTAVGERLPFLADLREAPDIDPARRVAALRLLGQKGSPVFRSTIESALGDLDARVRLAALEAIDMQRRPESFSVLLRVLGVERHPVVSQAAVRAVRNSLTKNRATLSPENRQRAIAAAMQLCGEAGWRTDMDLLDFIEEFPDKSAVPPLLDMLSRPASGDALVAAVNKNASPLLRARALLCLRGLTGAILPSDQLEQWREFWLRERDGIVVPDRLPHTRATGSTTSTFFGIPVSGSEIAFVIDSSGSMSTAVAGTATQSRPDPRATTRLGAAKEQIVQAVQAMPKEARYHVLTFDHRVRVWSRHSVPPTAQATRALVDLLSQVKPDGGTNVHQALVEALALDALHFGEDGKMQIDELFLLSDGVPTAGDVKDPDEILAIVKQANRYLHVRINTVFTGVGQGADFLRKLAEQNDGVFVRR
jgi:hypothetical protein